jgi:dynein heavy chain
MYAHMLEVDEYTQELYWNTFKWPIKTVELLKSSSEILEYSKSVILAKVEEETGYVDDSLVTIMNELKYFESLPSCDMCQIACKKLAHLAELVDSTILLKSSITERERALGLSETSFDEFEEGLEVYRNYKRLWDLVSDVQTCLTGWVNEWFANLNGDFMVKKVSDWNKIIKKCEEIFGFDTSSRNVLIEIKQDVDEFWRSSSVIAALINPALKNEHWQTISGIIGLNFQDFQSLKLMDIMDLDLELVQSVIKDISVEANYIHQVDQELEKMKTELSNLEFKLVLRKETNDYYITNFEEIQVVFDDQIIRCDAVINRINGQEIQSKFEKWCSQLQKGLEMLFGIQDLELFHRMYNPIFSSKTVEKSITKDAFDSFSSVSKIYSILSNIFLKNRKALTLLLRIDLLDLVLGSKMRIDAAKEGIRSHIGEMQMIFPRMYLVTEEIAIWTLSSVTPMALSSVLYNYFPPCAKLIDLANGEPQSSADYPSLDEASRKERKVRRSSLTVDAGKTLMERSDKVSNHKALITGVQSFEGEIIHFSEFIIFDENVTSNLGLLQNMLVKALSTSFQLAYAEIFGDDSRMMKDMDRYPDQIYNLVFKMKWNERLNDSVKGGKKFIFEYKTALAERLETLSQKYTTSMYPLEKLKMETALMILMYYTDLSESLSDVNYLLKYHTDKNDIFISIDSPAIKYGFEYLGHQFEGASSLNVIRKMFLNNGKNLDTIINAPYHLNAVNEIQEYSILTGKFHIIVNSQIFSIKRLKLALIGATKIPNSLVEIHTCAAQLQQFMQQLSDIKYREDSNSPLGFLFPVFIQVNNISPMKTISAKIKKYFNVLGFNSPTYDGLIEASLILNGFKLYRMLRRKMRLFLNSCRSYINFHPTIIKLKQIIKLAKDLKIQSPSLSEYGAIRSAILYYIKQELRVAQIGPLKELANNIFRTSSDESVTSLIANGVFQNSASALHLTQSDYLLQKCIGFFKMTENCQRLIILGEPSGGKTSTWKLCLHLINQILSPATRAKAFSIYPNAEISNVWEDPIDDFKSPFDEKFLEARKYAQRMEQLPTMDNEFGQCLSWIVFDGDVMSQWMTGANNWCNKNADESRLLFIFETSTISYASPDLLSAWGILLIEPKQIKSECMIDNIINSGREDLKQFLGFIQVLFNYLGQTTIKYMQELENWPNSIHAERIAIRRILTTFICLFDVKGKAGFARMTQSEQYLWIGFVFVFCIIWIVGADTSHQVKAQFDTYFKDMLYKNSKLSEELITVSSATDIAFEFEFPTEGTVFDYIIDEKSIRWVRWDSLETLKKDIGACSTLNNVILTNDLLQFSYFSKLYLHYNLPILVPGKFGVGKTASCNVGSAYYIQSYKKIAEPHVTQFYCTKSANGLNFKQLIEKMFPKKRHRSRSLLYNKTAVLMINDLENCFSYKNFNCIPEAIRMIAETGYWASTSGSYDQLQSLRIIGTLSSGKLKHEYARWAKVFMTIPVDDDELGKLTNFTFEAISKRFSKLFSSDQLNKIIQVSFEILRKLREFYKPTPVTPQYQFILRDCITSLRAIIHFPIKSYKETEFFSQWFHSIHRIYGDRLPDFSILNELVGGCFRESFNINVDEMLEGMETIVYVQPEVLLPNAKNRADFKANDLPFLIHSIDQIAFDSDIQKKKILNNHSARNICISSYHLQNAISNLIVGGGDVGNIKIIAQASAHITKRKFIMLGDIANWNSFVENVMRELLKNALLLIYIEADELNSATWTKILLLSKYGVPFTISKKTVEKPENSTWKKIQFLVSFRSSVRMREVLNYFPSLMSTFNILFMNQLDHESLVQYCECLVPVRPTIYSTESIAGFIQKCSKDISALSLANKLIDCSASHNLFQCVEMQQKLYSTWETIICDRIDSKNGALAQLNSVSTLLLKLRAEYDANLQVT